MAELEIRNRYRTGEHVSAWPRTSDTFRLGAVGDPVKTVKADEYGTATFTGLEEGPYWVSGEGSPERAVSTNAKAPAKVSDRIVGGGRVPPELAAQTRGHGHKGPGTTQGARDSESQKQADAARKRAAR
jgi:hypothetical protein